MIFSGNPQIRWLVGGIVLLLVAHLGTLNAPFVNQEWVFYEAVRSLLDPTYSEGFEKYWEWQANPLGYSLITALLIAITGLPVACWTVRLPSLAGGILLLVVGYRLSRASSPSNSTAFGLWVAVVLSNPIVWCYSGQATADVLPAAIGFWAGVEATLARNRVWQHVVASVLIALGTLLKFNCLLLIPGLILVAWLGVDEGTHLWRTRLLVAVGYLGFPALFLGIYAAWLYHTNDIWIMPEKFQALHRPIGSISQWLAVFLMYATYLAVLLGGLALWPFLMAGKCMSRRVFVATCGISVILAAVYAERILTFQLGEMNHGGFDHLLPRWSLVLARMGGLFISILLLLSLILRAGCDRTRFGLFVAATIVCYIGLASISRPAQRYLLLIFPLIAWFILHDLMARPRFHVVALIWVSVVAFAGLSGLGTIYLVAQGSAADRMARWIVTHGNPRETDPGADVIHAHAGQYFPARVPAQPLYVVQTKPFGGEVLHQEEVLVLTVHIRTY